jgi:hypothetical protein
MRVEATTSDATRKTSLLRRQCDADENGWCNSLKRRLAIGGTDAVENNGLMRSVHDGRMHRVLATDTAYAGAGFSSLCAWRTQALQRRLLFGFGCRPPWPVAEPAIPRLVSAQAQPCASPPAAGLGLCSIPFIRHACTNLPDLWLAVMPLFLPEPVRRT